MRCRFTLRWAYRFAMLKRSPNAESHLGPIDTFLILSRISNLLDITLDFILSNQEQDLKKVAVSPRLARLVRVRI